MELIRPAPEAEVIAEFLRSEYYQKEYHSDRTTYERLVLDADITDATHNVIRRNLLFRRHRITWSELPNDVHWMLVRLHEQDLRSIRVFPRGHWPRMAGGNDLSVSALADSIRKRTFAPSTKRDVCAIEAIKQQMQLSSEYGSVILIGLDQAHPFTILEGNHRMIAAALLSNSRLGEFRTYVGMSPLMNECFWYRGGPEAFVRHAFRRLKIFHMRLLAGLKSASEPLLSNRLRIG